MNHSVNVITFELAQSDPIKRQELYSKFAFSNSTSFPISSEHSKTKKETWYFVKNKDFMIQHILKSVRPFLNIWNQFSFKWDLKLWRASLKKSPFALNTDLPDMADSRHRTLASLGKWADLRTAMRVHKKGASWGEPLIQKAFFVAQIFVIQYYEKKNFNRKGEEFWHRIMPTGG